MADDDIEVRLRGRYAMLVNGLIKVEDLDDEEVARGQLKCQDGTWRGRPPKVIPAELVQAMRKEWLSRAEGKLREALMGPGIGTLVELARDRSVDEAVRLRASQTIIDRMMGKVPDKVEIRSEDPVESLFRSLMSDPQGLNGPRELSADERHILS